jgi:serine/threonine protein kinase
MEYVGGGDMFDYIVDNKRLSEELSRKLFRQLVSALLYCHHNMIVHRGKEAIYAFENSE